MINIQNIRSARVDKSLSLKMDLAVEWDICKAAVKAYFSLASNF